MFIYFIMIFFTFLAIQPELQLECARQFLRQSLTLLNARSNSPLPEETLRILRTIWLPLVGGWRNPLLIATMLEAGICVANPEHLSPLLESCLQTFFKEEDDGEEAFQAEVEKVNGDAWSLALPHLTLPADQKKLDGLVKMSVEQGNGLVLYAVLRSKLAKCSSLKDEEKLLRTVLDWVKGARWSEVLEPKLPLLYASLFLLIQRQIEHGDAKAVVSAYTYLTDLVEALEKSSHARGTSLFSLSALGIGSTPAMTPRARFLALSLALLIRSNISEETAYVFLRRGDADAGATKPTPSEPTRHLTNLLENLKTQKAYFGLSDLIDHVLTLSKDNEKDIRSPQEFVHYVLCNGLYVEKYLNTYKQ